jgi:hypothetical protein
VRKPGRNTFHKIVGTPIVWLRTRVRAAARQAAPVRTARRAGAVQGEQSALSLQAHTLVSGTSSRAQTYAASRRLRQPLGGRRSTGAIAKQTVGFR